MAEFAPLCRSLCSRERGFKRLGDNRA